MNNEEKNMLFTIKHMRIVMAVMACLMLLGFLTGIAVGSQTHECPSEAVDASETTETVVEDTTAPVEIPEASVVTEAVTEPVIAATTLPLETVIETTDAVVEETVPVTEPVEETIVEPVVELDWYPPEDPSPDDELGLLACVIYQEAGGNESCDECRRRVADVVLNRMAHTSFPYTMHGVLTQYMQYGRFWWTGVTWPDRAKSDSASERAAVERAYRIAEEVFSGKHSELFGKGYIWQAEFVQGYDNVFHCGHYYGR